MMARISGSGGGGGGKGGGGGSRSPSQAADSLNSRQYATVIDLIAEGEIGGLVNGLNSVFYNNTPVQSLSGNFNFTDVSIETRYGTQDQEPLSAANDSQQNEVPVGLSVINGVPITKTITDTTIDAIRITIAVPQLQKVQSNGDIVGSSFKFAIDAQYNGAGFFEVATDTVTGRTGDLYNRAYVLKLNGGFPVDIRLRRISPDSTSAAEVNAFSWSSYTEITYVKLRYPNSAIIGHRVDASQFNSIPTRSFLVNGKKVKIPTNATVDSATGRLIYSGIWDGSFGAAQWCSDPAWVLWDLLLATRYGFGDHLKIAMLDRWAFYAASQYCSELVPNGYGGYEPRFSCNVNIQTPQEAYTLINNLCSVMRAMNFWSAGYLTLSQDRPSDPVYLLNSSNVVDGEFTYQDSSSKTRPTVAIVSYFDLDLRDTVKEVVEDQDAIRKYGSIVTEVDGFACTSRGQARRIGKWLLYTEQAEAEAMTTAVSIESGIVLRPGMVVAVMDLMKAGMRRGGRIAASTASSVTVDDASGLSSGFGQTLSVILPSGALESRPVVGITDKTIFVSPAFTLAPNPNSVWIHEIDTNKAAFYRILSVGEQNEISYQISALPFNPQKFDFIEKNIKFEPRQINNLNVAPPAPANLSASEDIHEANGRVAVKIPVSWPPVGAAQQYSVQWRYENGNWNTSIQQGSVFEILDTLPGLYQIKVFSISISNRYSIEPAVLNYNAKGKLAPPADVSGVSLVPIDDTGATITWNMSPDLDVRIGGSVIIRHTPLTSGFSWASANDIVSNAPGSATQIRVPLLSGTYLLKFEDDTGNRSINATSVLAVTPAPGSKLTVQEYAEQLESPPFSGTLTNMYYDADRQGLILSDGPLFDTLATDGNFDGLATIDDPNPFMSGEYNFGTTLDLLAVYDANIRRHILSSNYAISQYFDDRRGLIDDWDDFDAGNLDSANAVLYVRATNDNPSGSPVWGAWQEIINGTLRGRAFQFKLAASRSDPSINILVKELGCVVEMQQRTEQSPLLTSGAGVYSAVFTNPFYQAPSISITPYDLGGNEYFEVTNVTRTGFDIQFFHGGGSHISRQFTYAAIGNGRAIL